MLWTHLLNLIELALGRQTITPCFVKGTITYMNIHTEGRYVGFYAKLNLMLNARKDRKSLQKENAEECLSCACKHDHVCLMPGVAECALRIIFPDLLESEDELHRVFLAIPVRKNFPLKDAFRNFVRRIVETSLLRELRACAPLPLSAELHDEDSDSLHIGELYRFFALFAMLLGCCSVVFLLEVVVVNCKVCPNIMFSSRVAMQRMGMRY